LAIASKYLLVVRLAFVLASFASWAVQKTREYNLREILQLVIGVSKFVQRQWTPLNVIADNVIVRLMWSLSVCPNVITLSGFHYSWAKYGVSFQALIWGQKILKTFEENLVCIGLDHFEENISSFS
jgi:hypothetical protein